ncbi:MAG TPA: hypothetical protein VGG31_09395 [Candidatus Dormibacteraeota bacterium]
MKLATVAQWTVRICGLVLIVLGALIWTGHGDQLVDVHETFGILLVIGLWTLAFLGARAGLPVGLVVVAFVWGLIAPALGLTQANILNNGWHWVIQVIHLLIGLGAIGIAEQLGRRIRKATPATTAA